MTNVYVGGCDSKCKPSCDNDEDNAADECENPNKDESTGFGNDMDLNPRNAKRNARKEARRRERQEEREERRLERREDRHQKRKQRRMNPLIDLRDAPCKEKEPQIQDRTLERLLTQPDNVLETPITGFPTEIGEPTFEELKDAHDPGPYMSNPNCCTAPNYPSLQDEKLTEEEESTLPPSSGAPPPTPPPTPPPGSVQYTPEETETLAPSGSEMVNTLTTLSQAVPSVSSQDPDGIGWISPALWTASEWDGTPMSTPGKTNTELCNFLKPTGNPYVVRGIREKFYQVNPFADNTNPTPAEIDNWTIEVIRHFRAMFGINVPVEPDARLFIEARWASERKNTTYWDTKYPGLPPEDWTTPPEDPINGQPGTAKGRCFVSGNPIDVAGGHCGEAFFPDEVDRQAAIMAPPYNSDFVTYPELNNYTLRQAQTTGIKSVNADLPWSIKFSVVLAGWICGEGTTGHPGPYVNPSTTRTKFGSAWWYDGGVLANFRGKWR